MCTDLMDALVQGSARPLISRQVVCISARQQLVAIPFSSAANRSATFFSAHNYMSESKKDNLICLAIARLHMRRVRHALTNSSRVRNTASVHMWEGGWFRRGFLCGPGADVSDGGVTYGRV